MNIVVQNQSTDTNFTVNNHSGIQLPTIKNVKNHCLTFVRSVQRHPWSVLSLFITIELVAEALP